MSGKVCFPVENRLKLSMVTSRTNRGGRIKIIDRNSREVLICREFNDSDPRAIIYLTNHKIQGSLRACVSHQPSRCQVTIWSSSR